VPETNARRPRGRPRDNHDARRDEIVDIAAQLFAERGYHATSISDLTQATGLHRGGLYHYIESKENLLFLIHERFIAPLLEEAHAIEARGEPPDVRLRALGHALMRDIATYHDQVTVFLHEWRSVATATRDAERAQRVRLARRDFEAVITRTLRAGVEQGYFRIPEPHLAMLGFLGMINYSYQWLRAGHDVDVDGVADVFCSVFLDGIRAR
jgi:AcrR family transcriptional regulator